MDSKRKSAANMTNAERAEASREMACDYPDANYDNPAQEGIDAARADARRADDENKNVTEDLIATILQNEFEHGSIAVYLEEEIPGVAVSTRTFGESGLLTSDSGLVVRIGGHEFHITIARSR